ncbi:DUF3885 domain-containing protein [Romboutsia sp. 1001285H_161024_C4]|uniref:DUF3885 domain-containing protein n=1 Tax=Romboutsia sp. 1001285H_161024_C4 TaxID=2787109 RepID=UPI00189AA372|nr:hypothetical protein [Romboutsia sp. 1001285H_161024_C4]
MDLYVNSLTNKQLNKNKICISFDLEVNESPYYEMAYSENEELNFRPEYVDLCAKSAQNIWDKCNFSNDLIVLFEDKYNTYHKGEKEFIENCLNSPTCFVYSFEWNDEGEKFKATRYIWVTNKIDSKSLFRKIILSDIGEDTVLDGAVYIIDNKTKNVFFLYDDRGVDIYSNDEKFIYKMKNYYL